MQFYKVFQNMVERSKREIDLEFYCSRVKLASYLRIAGFRSMHLKFTLLLFFREFKRVQDSYNMLRLVTQVRGLN